MCLAGEEKARPKGLAFTDKRLHPQDYNLGLNRHFQADWGDLCEEDLHMNDQALRIGGRLFSVYHTPEKVRYWVITEADYSVTTILLPEDY